MTAGDSARARREAFVEALGDTRVVAVAERLRENEEHGLVEMLELGHALALACEDHSLADRLNSELEGYESTTQGVPNERKALGFASPFPVRALDMGVLDPEEIFLGNKEKFSQVSLTIAQPVRELMSALVQIRDGGVLAVKVPASEVTSESADTDVDTEVFIYILPREIQRIIECARTLALRTVVGRLVHVALGD